MLVFKQDATLIFYRNFKEQSKKMKQ